MARKLSNVIILMALGIALLLLYTIVHEGGHALAVLIFRGKVTAFDSNFLTGFPHVSYEGAMTPWQSALVSLAGPLAPYLLLTVGLLFMNKKRNIFVQKTFALASIMILGSIIPNIIIPVLSETGADATGEDIVNFMTQLNLNGYLVSAAMFMLLALGIGLVASRLNFKDALVYELKIAPRGIKLFLPVLLLGLFLLATLAYAGYNIVSRSLGFRYRPVPGDYSSFLNVDLADLGGDETVICEFRVDEPAVYDFVVTAKTAGFIRLKLIGSSRITGLRTKEMVICEGRGRMNANWTNWTLNRGTYRLLLEGESNRGDFQVGINSRDAGDLWSEDHDEMILAGKVPEQEKGMELVAKESLADCLEKQIYTFSLDKEKMIFFSIYLTTREGRALVELVGDNHRETLIQENQIVTEKRGSYLKKGDYQVIMTCSGCRGDIYLFCTE